MPSVILVASALISISWRKRVLFITIKGLPKVVKASRCFSLHWLHALTRHEENPTHANVGEQPDELFQKSNDLRVQISGGEYLR